MNVNKDLQSKLMSLFPPNEAPRYFVEAGAHDGDGDSQTLWLEQLGWNGLCVEPSLSGILGLERNRKCSIDNRCLWSSDGEVLFREVDGEARELSGIIECFYDHWDREVLPHGDRYVECVTLHRMLSEHKAPPCVDFLCLDTEGSEPAILNAHDYTQYRLAAIWVEYNGVLSRRNELYSLMLSKGYTVSLDTHQDILFLHNSVTQ